MTGERVVLLARREVVNCWCSFEIIFVFSDKGRWLFYSTDFVLILKCLVFVGGFYPFLGQSY